MPAARRRRAPRSAGQGTHLLAILRVSHSNAISIATSAIRIFQYFNRYFDSCFNIRGGGGSPDNLLACQLRAEAVRREALVKVPFPPWKRHQGKWHLPKVDTPLECHLNQVAV